MRAFFFFILFFFISLAGVPGSRAQTITTGDGSPLATKYCHDDFDFPLFGQPAGGVFSGCGVIQQGGQWYFNAVAASQGATVFPFQCDLSYTVGGSTLTLPILVWKPVIISPPLEDSFTCSGSFYLHAQTLHAGAYDYTWSPAAPLDFPNSANTPGAISSSQTFVLSARDLSSGCIGGDTITIAKYPAPLLSAGPDTIINARDQVALWATGADRYFWQPSRWLNMDTVPNPLASPESAVSYQVIGINDYGCMDTAVVHIDIREELFVPNAFSPNGDGVNDIFRVENYGYQRVESFRIFNRWGQQVYQTIDATKGWDGTQNGKPVALGAYYYDIRLSMPDGTAKIFRGEVTLLR